MCQPHVGAWPFPGPRTVLHPEYEDRPLSHALCPDCGRRLRPYLGDAFCGYCQPEGPPPLAGPAFEPEPGPGLTLKLRHPKRRRKRRRRADPDDDGPRWPAA